MSDSSKLAIEFFGNEVSQLELVLVDLLISQGSVHVSIVDAEAQALALGLGMHELVD